MSKKKVKKASELSAAEKVKSTEPANDAKACFGTAEKYYAQKKYDEAFHWYMETIACKNPNPVAYFNIAYAYQYGEGTGVDMISAFDYYEKAAAYGLPQALYNLAFFYQNGIIAPRDERKAVRLCREANLRLSELEDKIHQLQTKNDELNENYLEALRIADGFDGVIRSEESRRSRIEEDKRIAEKKLYEAEVSLGKAAEKQSLLEKSLKTAEKEKRELQDSVKRAESAVADRNMSIHSLNVETDRLKAETDRLNKSIDGLNQSLSTERWKVESMTANANSLMAENMRYKDSIAMLQKRCTETEREIASARDQGSRLTAQIEAASALKVKLLITIGALGGGLTAAIAGLVIAILTLR